MQDLYLMDTIDDIGLREFEDQLEEYRRELSFLIRHTVPAEEIIMMMGYSNLRGREDKVYDWMIDLVEDMFEQWNLLVEKNQDIDTNGIPVKPSKLIVKGEPNGTTSPSFLKTAKILVVLGRTSGFDKKKTNATTPNDVLQQALGQEMVSMANILVGYVQKGLYRLKLTDLRKILDEQEEPRPTLRYNPSHLLTTQRPENIEEVEFRDWKEYKKFVDENGGGKNL